ncbi:MAG TPA: hypothetical protein ENJ37_06915 [Deltaproteobacteria bacterium]|nr:hypothetical protein [Deltaproteobacteria bacterium]
MSALDSIKEHRNLFVLAVAAALAVLVAVVVFTGPAPRQPQPGGGTLAVSKRIKIDIPPEPARPVKEPEKKVEPEKTVKAPAYRPAPAKEPAVTPKRKVAGKLASRAPAAKKPGAGATPAEGKGRYAVNLASFLYKPEAMDVMSSLKAAGHNAYVTEFVKDGQRWYRVRVGFFASRDEAAKAGKRLSEEFRLPGAWVVKPSESERKAHGG